MGHRGFVDPGRGRGSGIRLVRAGALRRDAAEPRRQRLRRTVRRRLCSLRAARARSSSSLDRVGAHRTRGRPARRRGDRAHDRGAHGGARCRRRAMGLPSPLHASGLVHRVRRGPFRRRPRPFLLLGPARGVLRGDVRRSRVRLEADQRARRVRGHLPARKEAIRHARRDAACAARRLARVARGRQAGRDGSQPLTGLHRRRHHSRRLDAGSSRRHDVGRMDARRSRRRARASGPTVARGSRPTRSVRPRRFLVLQRDGRQRRGRRRAVSDFRAGRSDGLRAVE